MKTVIQRVVAANQGSEVSSAAGCLFYCPATDRVLLVKRSPDSDNPGTWALLGGTIEEGESPEEGLRRELYEEACIRNLPNPVHVHSDVSEDFVYLTYLCKVGKEFTPRLNHEHTDYQWCSKDDLPDNLHPCFEPTYNQHLVHELN